MAPRNPSSTTSIPEMVPWCRLNRRTVRILWNPSLPAAPGLRYSIFFSLASRITRRICECPHTKISGVSVCSRGFTIGLYRGGAPPIWVIQIRNPSSSKVRFSTDLTLISWLSMLPNTTLSGLNFSNLSRIAPVPTSPACHTSSQSLK